MIYKKQLIRLIYILTDCVINMNINNLMYY